MGKNNSNRKGRKMEEAQQDQTGGAADVEQNTVETSQPVATPAVDDGQTVSETQAPTQDEQAQGSVDVASAPAADEAVQSEPVHAALGTVDMAAEAVAASAPVAPVVTPTQPVIGEKSSGVAPLTFEDFLTSWKTTGSTNVQALVTSLENYIEHMKPGKLVDSATGARHQYSLWHAIKTVTHRAPAEEFSQLWNILLAFVNEYRDSVFNDRYAFRFSEMWKQPIAELNGLQRTLNLLILTADPKGRRAAIKHIDLNRTLSDGFSEPARNRILNFYNRF